MAVGLPYSRALTKHLLATSSRSFTRPTTSAVLRVSCTCVHQQTIRDEHLSFAAIFRQARTYATAPAKAPRKPKASSTRTATVKKTTTTVKKAVTKKPAKKKVTKKPKKKAVKKTKPKARKPPSKAALAKKERASHANLRSAALLDRPKQLPSTAYQVLLMAEVKSGRESNLKGWSTAASAKYKTLSPEEREALNHQANSNKSKNELAYKSWVQNHSPLEIKKANNARKLLSSRAKAAGKKTRYHAIPDDRAVKQPRNPLIFFSIDRHASGDFKGLSISESSKLIAREWAELSASHKKPYTDRSAADKNRYVEEHKSVYGADPPSLSKTKA